MSTEPLVILVSGPSGAGKSTLIARLLQAEPSIGFSVSATTRPPRSGEVDGRDYHFVSDDEFGRMVADDRLIEWARVYNNSYGTPKSEVARLRDAGRDGLFDLDIVGGLNLMRYDPKTVSIFILPPEYHDLRARLEARGKDDKATIDSRLGMVAEQCRGIEHYGYVIVNDDVDVAANELIAVVRAERARTLRRIERARKILATFDH
jgi:guanylate kinase